MALNKHFKIQIHPVEPVTRLLGLFSSSIRLIIGAYDQLTMLRIIIYNWHLAFYIYLDDWLSRQNSFLMHA